MAETKIGLDNHICASHMILQRDLNPHETLFAGQAVSYIIECGFLEAMDFLGTKHLVCQGVEGMRFMHPVHKADAIHITTSVIHLGKTSAGIYVSMFVVPEHIKAAEGFVTFVQIDEASGHAQGHNMTLKPLSAEDSKLTVRYEALRSVKRI